MGVAEGGKCHMCVYNREGGGWRSGFGIREEV